MSQWGAYGMAKDGWGYRRILTHFYSGTRVVDATLPSKVRVGLTRGRSTIQLTARSGPVELWLDRPGATFVARIPGGQTWTVSAAPALRKYAIRDGAGALVTGARVGGPARPLFVTYRDGARVFVPEADEVWHEGFAYAYGFLEFDLYACPSHCVERLTIELPLERYLRGLGEMPSSWPGGALRAQAVAARTFATYKIRRYGLRSDCDCHVEDGAGDQVYVGWSKESGPDGERWVAAVTDTAGEVVTYGGSVIQAFYAASDGGYSEDVEDVWHGGNPAFAIPYLRGVCDPGEDTTANPWTDWTRTFSASNLSSRLSPYTGDIGTDLLVRERAPRGLGPDRERDGARGRRQRVRQRDRAPVGPGPPGRAGLDQPRSQHHRCGPCEVRRRDVSPGAPSVGGPHAGSRLAAALRARRDLPERDGRPHGLAAGVDPRRVPGGRGAHEVASGSRCPTRCARRSREPRPARDAAGSCWSRGGST